MNEQVQLGALDKALQAIADALGKQAQGLTEIAKAVDLKSDVAALTALVRAHLSNQDVINRQVSKAIEGLTDQGKNHESRLCVAEDRLSALKNIPTSHAKIETRVGVISAGAAIVGGFIMAIFEWALRGQ